VISNFLDIFLDGLFLLRTCLGPTVLEAAFQLSLLDGSLPLNVRVDLVLALLE
jgi:hypothetical protein